MAIIMWRLFAPYVHANTVRRRTALVLLWALFFLRTAFVHAEVRGAVVVRGAASQPDKDTAATAVVAAVKTAGWSLASHTFTTRDTDAIVKCLVVTSPWRCVSRIVRDKSILRMAVLSLDLQRASDGTATTLVTTSIVVAEQEVAYSSRRYCSPCTSDLLIQAATAVTKEVLERIYLQSGKTFLQVTSTPAGASISVNGKEMGVTDSAFAMLPGSYHLVVKHPSFPEQARTVEVAADKTTKVALTFVQPNAVVPLAAAPLAAPNESTATVSAPWPQRVIEPEVPQQGDEQPSRVFPLTLVSIGVIAMAGGLIAVAYDQDQADQSQAPNVEQPRRYRDTGLLGAALLGSGAVTAGIGGWLWWRQAKTVTPPSRPIATMAVGRREASVVVSGSF
jgi:PEGA domain